VLAGANVTYTLTLRNNGPDTALNVVLTDPIPANTTFVSATSDPAFTPTLPAVGSGPPAVVTYAAPSLANGATATFTVTVRANASAPPGSVVNVATVATASVDPNVANNVATANFGIGAPPATVTPTPTATPPPIVVPVIPQIFQNPGALGIFQPSRPTATPVRPSAAPASAAPSNVAPATGVQPVVLRPPSTGDAGLWRFPHLSAW